MTRTNIDNDNGTLILREEIIITVKKRGLLPFLPTEELVTLLILRAISRRRIPWILPIAGVEGSASILPTDYYDSGAFVGCRGPDDAWRALMNCSWLFGTAESRDRE